VATFIVPCGSAPEVPAGVNCTFDQYSLLLTFPTSNVDGTYDLAKGEATAMFQVYQDNQRTTAGCLCASEIQRDVPVTSGSIVVSNSGEVLAFSGFEPPVSGSMVVTTTCE
jgi:hypothetical protein